MAPAHCVKFVNLSPHCSRVARLVKDFATLEVPQRDFSADSAGISLRALRSRLLPLPTVNGLDRVIPPPHSNAGRTLPRLHQWPEELQSRTCSPIARTARAPVRRSERTLSLKPKSRDSPPWGWLL